MKCVWVGEYVLVDINAEGLFEGEMIDPAVFNYFAFCCSCIMLF